MVPEVGIEPTNLSQQLAVLRRAGLVTTRKEGSAVIYSLTSPVVAELLAVARRIMTEVLTGQVELLEDVAMPPAAAEGGRVRLRGAARPPSSSRDRTGAVVRAARAGRTAQIDPRRAAEGGDQRAFEFPCSCRPLPGAAGAASRSPITTSTLTLTDRFRRLLPLPLPAAAGPLGISTASRAACRAD